MRHKSQFLELLHKIYYFLKNTFYQLFLPYFDYKNNQIKLYLVEEHLKNYMSMIEKLIEHTVLVQRVYLDVN